MPERHPAAPSPGGPPPRCLVIGIGTPGRGDDGVGALVLALLRQRPPRADAGTSWPPWIAFIDHPGPPLDLLAWLPGADRLYLVDACRSGTAAGTWYRFDLAAGALPARRFGCSSHGLDLAATLELARALGSLPATTVVYAIEAASFAPGPPGPAVAASAVAVSRAIGTALAATLTPHSATDPV